MDILLQAIIFFVSHKDVDTRQGKMFLYVLITNIYDIQVRKQKLINSKICFLNLFLVDEKVSVN